MGAEILKINVIAENTGARTLMLFLILSPNPCHLEGEEKNIKDRYEARKEEGLCKLRCTFLIITPVQMGGSPSFSAS